MPGRDDLCSGVEYAGVENAAGIRLPLPDSGGGQQPLSRIGRVFLRTVVADGHFVTAGDALRLPLLAGIGL
ncbi:hypothetical protein SDC9_186603 [bioreactor metagenome]|uniref:Uncharacterized protein n=1 Tax=bioreactor metagenome TaxID=1076179 RepID=A0A645HJC6_9ZZZZ